MDQLYLGTNDIPTRIDYDTFARQRRIVGIFCYRVGIVSHGNQSRRAGEEKMYVASNTLVLSMLYRAIGPATAM